MQCVSPWCLPEASLNQEHSCWMWLVYVEVPTVGPSLTVLGSLHRASRVTGVAPWEAVLQHVCLGVVPDSHGAVSLQCAGDVDGVTWPSCVRRLAGSHGRPSAQGSVTCWPCSLGEAEHAGLCAVHHCLQLQAASGRVCFCGVFPCLLAPTSHRPTSRQPVNVALSATAVVPTVCSPVQQCQTGTVYHTIVQPGPCLSEPAPCSAVCAVLCCAGSHLVFAAPVSLQAPGLMGLSRSLACVFNHAVVLLWCSGVLQTQHGKGISVTRIKRQVSQAQPAPAVSAHGCGGPWWQLASAAAAVSGVHGKYTCVVARRAAHAEGLTHPAHNGHSGCGP
jgi:hypothetical protein